MKSFTINKWVQMAMLTALGVVFVTLIRFPIFPQVPFLIYDPADIPILIGGFMFGPVAGIVMTVVVSGLQALLMSGDGMIGFVMHVLSTGALVTVSSLVYKRFHTRKGALCSLIAGSFAMVAVMVPANIILDPIFYGVTVDLVMSLLVFIAAFNAIKAVANSAVVFLVYKPLHRFFEARQKKPEVSPAQNTGG